MPTSCPFPPLPDPRRPEVSVDAAGDWRDARSGEKQGPENSTRVLARKKGEEVRAQLVVPDRGDETNLPQRGFRAFSES